MAVTVQELADHFKLSTDSDLNQQVSEEHIKEISTFLESWKLVAPHLGLGQGAIEAIDNDGKNEEQKRILMLQKWKQALFFKATYQKLLEALLAVQRADLGGKVCEMMAASSHHSAQKPDVKQMRSKHADELRSTLSLITRWEDLAQKTAAQEGAVTNFIHQCIKSEHSLKEVEQQLQVLSLEEFLISKEVNEKCQKIAANEYAKNESQPVPKPRTSTTESTETRVVEKLFCKDTIYHASVCSQAVSSYTAGDYQKFFKDRTLVPGHGFEAVSFSRRKEERLLIAQKGESTFYFAFKGQPNLSYWTKGYKSISEGIMKQCEMFPIRYIIELLNKQHRIVLTGFSFGGLLASVVTACVWDTPYISSDLLKNNMICVTFGQPHVSVDFIQRVARRRPEMVATINDIVIEEDEIPVLMGLLDESWSDKAQRSQNSSTQNVHMTAIVNHANPLEDKTTSELLNMFAQVQEGRADAKGVQKIIALLHEILECTGSTSRQLTPNLTSYCVSTKERDLVLTPVTGLTDSQIQMLSETMFNKHSMTEYSKGIFEGHLDKHPKYFFPQTACRALDDMADLKPSVNGILIHHHGSESAIVIEGINLWFCYQVSFRGQKMCVPASDISGSSIQFNVGTCPSNSELRAGEKEVVSIESYFKAKPTKFEVQVFEKIPTGTTEGRRTTVPFLYNLEESVEGLNVVDFPGVDDEDDSIGDLADLLLTIAQIIVFVVDYRKVHTQSAKKWLERLHKEKVPTLVCLTFGDKLYAEHMTDSGEHPSVGDMSKVIKSQLSVTKDKLRPTGSHQVQFFSFCQDKDSVLNTDEGRKKLKAVGIESPLQVGEWLVKVFREDFQQDELANHLEVFMNKNTK